MISMHMIESQDVALNWLERDNNNTLCVVIFTLDSYKFKSQHTFCNCITINILILSITNLVRDAMIIQVL